MMLPKLLIVEKVWWILDGDARSDDITVQINIENMQLV